MSVGIPIVGPETLQLFSIYSRSWEQGSVCRVDVHGYEDDGSSGSTRIRIIVSDISVEF